MLDRLLHHAEVTVIEGSTYRVRESEQEQLPDAEEEMNPPNPVAAYVAAVVTLYMDMPDTPMRISASDQWLARHFYQDGVPLETVETALLLGSLRRLIRRLTLRVWRPSAPWPTSVQSSRNSRRIPPRKTTANTSK